MNNQNENNISLSDFKCEYCDKIFTTKSNLTAHKKTVKSCKNDTDKKTYTCEYCHKNLSSINGLKYHYTVCNLKKENEIKENKDKENTQTQIHINNLLRKQKEDLEKTHDTFIKNLEKNFLAEISQYKNEIQTLNISSKILETKLENSEIRLEEYRRQIDFLQNKGTATTNNTTHIHGDKTVIFNTYFTPEFLSEGMKDYDENLVCHGMAGLAAYVKDKFLKVDGKLIYTCTDAARQHFKFAYDGKEINDKTAAMLVRSLKPALINQLMYLSKQLNTMEDRLESIPKSDRTEEQKTKLDVTKHIITNKLNPLTIDIRELETNHKLSLELSRLV